MKTLEDFKKELSVDSNWIVIRYSVSGYPREIECRKVVKVYEDCIYFDTIDGPIWFYLPAEAEISFTQEGNAQIWTRKTHEFQAEKHISWVYAKVC